MAFSREVLNTKIQDIIKDNVFNSRDRFITVTEAKRINILVKQRNHRVPLFAHSFFSSNFSSEQFNRAFDQIYLDTSIMLQDVSILFGLLNNNIRKIQSKLIRPRLIIKRTITAIKDYIESRGFNNTYNKIDIISMNSAINHYIGNDKLTVDQSTGSLKLAINTSRVFSGDASIDIKITPLTTTLVPYEESPIDDLFDVNSTFYTAYYGKHIKNPIPYEKYNGLVIAFDIIFPGTVNINTLKLRLVSDELQDILGVSYTTGGDLNISSIPITDYKIVNNSYIYEMEFDTIQASSIRLILGSKIFKEDSSGTTIPGKILPDFIENLKDEIRNIQVEEASFVPVKRNISIKDRLKNRVYAKDKIVEPGYKYFILPIRSLEASHTKYNPYGVYQSIGSKLSGNMTYATMETTETPNNNVIVLKKLVINGQDYTISPLDDNGNVSDVAIINLDEPTNPGKRYYIETNIIPDTTQPITLTLLGNAINPNYVDIANAIPLAKGIRIYLKTGSGAVEGATIQLLFKPIQFDRNGAKYDPRSLDILESIGKPNVREFIYANKNTNFVYFYDSNFDVVRYHYDDIIIDADTGKLVIGPNTNGEVLGSGISETITSANGNNLFVINNPYYGLYDGGYVFIKDELIVQSDNIGIFVETINAYVTNMIVCQNNNGDPIPIVSEYDINLGAYSDFRKLYLDNNLITVNDTIFALYMPIPFQDGSFPPSLVNNIERPNINLDIKLEKEVTEIQLERYPYIDPGITNSTRFIKTLGLFYFKDIESIIYEPIIVLMNGQKIDNSKLQLNGDTLISKIPLNGNIQIKYYSMSDQVAYKIEMFASNITREDTTPRVLSILGLLKVRN